MSPIHIAFITDNDYVIPTCVAISSIIESKLPKTQLFIHIVCASLSQENCSVFDSFSSDTVTVEIILQDADRFFTLHKVVKCVASRAALLKFVLPELFPDLSKLLYLDGDILVKGDLTELYQTELQNNYAACVLNSFTFYRRHHPFEDTVENYFNSGVMLLNLQLMRKNNITEQLIEAKQNTKSYLMDQVVLNTVFDKRILLLPFRYNYQILSLPGTKDNIELKILNNHFGTKYKKTADLLTDAVIIHFASRSKPWNTPSTPLFDEWYLTYMRSPVYGKLPPLSQLFGTELEKELSQIHHSCSFIIGQIITWLPFNFFKVCVYLKNHAFRTKKRDKRRKINV